MGLAGSFRKSMATKAAKVVEEIRKGVQTMTDFQVMNTPPDEPDGHYSKETSDRITEAKKRQGQISKKGSER